MWGRPEGVCGALRVPWSAASQPAGSAWGLGPCRAALIILSRLSLGIPALPSGLLSGEASPDPQTRSQVPIVHSQGPTALSLVVLCRAVILPQVVTCPFVCLGSSPTSPGKVDLSASFVSTSVSENNAPGSASTSACGSKAHCQLTPILVTIMYRYLRENVVGLLHVSPRIRRSSQFHTNSHCFQVHETVRVPCGAGWVGRARPWQARELVFPLWCPNQGRAPASVIAPFPPPKQQLLYLEFEGRGMLSM